jgi:hypothetical protein
MADGVDTLNSVHANFVINEVLSYIQFYRNKVTHDNLKKTVLNFYVADEIAIAKETLWSKCSSLGDKPGRRGTSARSLQDADVTDILNAFKKIDESGINVPTFVSMKLDRLPRYDPEEINIFSLIDRLSSMERELITVKQDVAHLKSVPSTECRRPDLYSNVVALPPCSTLKGCNVPAQSRNHATNDDGSRLTRNNMAPPIAAQAKLPAAISTGFTVVSNRGNRRKARPAVVGTKKSDLFHGCRHRISLFVSRAPSDYSEQQIRNMVQDTGVEILELKKISHPSANMSSFKMTVYKDDEEKLMISSVWPEFIACRRYIPPRRRVEGVDHSDSHVVGPVPIRKYHSDWDEANDRWEGSTTSDT